MSDKIFWIDSLQDSDKDYSFSTVSTLADHRKRSSSQTKRRRKCNRSCVFF